MAPLKFNWISHNFEKIIETIDFFRILFTSIISGQSNDVAKK